MRFIWQAAAVPYRVRETIEVCLLTTYSGRKWGLPKGIIDPGEDVLSTIANEAWEEGGLRGEISDQTLVRLQYCKWGAVLDVDVRLMEVTDCASTWLEEDFRQRLWCTFEDALELVTRSGYLHCLRIARQQLA